MSTVSGVFPNAITPTFALSSDPAEQSRLRKENETAVFAPVEEPEKSTDSRRSAREQPGKLEAEVDTRQTRPAPSANAEIESRANSEERSQEESARSNEASREEAPSGSEQNQRVEQQAEQAKRNAEAEQAKLQDDIETIRELAARDREVKAHEQAHQSVGGQYAGAMQFSYTQGPDGKRYATAGEVGISVSPVPNNPEATLRKAEQVRRAALAPAEPSAQDRQVAALATQLSMEAQNDLRQLERQMAEKTEEERSEQRDIQGEDSSKVEANSESEDKRSEEVSESNKERLNDILNQTSETVESALDAAYQVNRQQEVGFNLDTTV
ncbi:hypothetical protein KO489_08025 [Reinekea forsetii]|nr:hypothetical protein [Reinekea forsetii]